MTAGRRNRILLVGGGVVALVALAVVAVFVFLVPDDAPPREAQQSGGGTGAVIDPATLTGSWKVVPGLDATSTYAGYRVEEVFAAGARRVTAIGTTASVTGSLTVADGTVETGKIEVDLTELRSDEGRRDQQIRTRGLQTDEFPTATFELTTPIALPELRDGTVASNLKATGKLTLHGVSRTIPVSLDLKPLGSTFTIDASVPVAFADYDIEAPSIGGFVKVEDQGHLEFRITFGRS